MDINKWLERMFAATRNFETAWKELQDVRNGLLSENETPESPVLQFSFPYDLTTNDILVNLKSMLPQNGIGYEVVIKRDSPEPKS